MVQRVKKNINFDNGEKTVWRESFRGSENTICSERRAMKDKKIEKREDETAADDEDHRKYDKKVR